MTVDAEFDGQVYGLVAAVPAGGVITYGQIALLLGRPGNARRVGRALRYAPEGLPCHRVVNAGGNTAPGWPEQRNLLRAEGVPLKESGAVDLKKCRWWPDEHRKVSADG